MAADNEFRFFVAEIIDAFAHTGTYTVRIPGLSIVPARELLPLFNATPLGARPVAAYAPQTPVLVIHSPTMTPPAIILGSLASAIGSAVAARPDHVVVRGMAGTFQDAMHRQLLLNPDAYLQNRSAGRPVDVVAGDWGAINELGLRILLGKLSVCMGAGSVGRVEVFRDGLVRIGGRDVDFWTSGREDLLINDQGEYSEISRSTPYAWEGLGIADRDGDPFRDEESPLEPDKPLAAVEPKEDDQLLISREVKIRGYIGDLDRRWMAAPPEDLDVETWAARTCYAGLSEILRGFDGTLARRSASRIVSIKQPILPVPKPLVPPGDPLGDNAGEEWPPAGRGVTLDEFDSGEVPSQDAIIDAHVWLFNRRLGDGLTKHKKDWYWPEEADYAEDGFDRVTIPGSLLAQTSYWLPPPSYKTLKIDDRATQRVYQGRSTISQEPDGSILLEDAWGSRILMGHGHIEQSCALDHKILPGRSAVTLAPRDFIARAGNSFDGTAGKGDMRLAARKNMHVVSGIDGEGGLLLENRAIQPPTASDFEQPGSEVRGHGIIVKTVKSGFQVLSKDVYIGAGIDEPGKFVLDAGEQGEMFVRGGTRATWLAQSSFQFVLGTSSQRVVAEFNTSMFSIDAAVRVGGQLAVVKDRLGGDAFLSVDGAAEIAGTLVGGQGGLFKESVLTEESFGAKGSDQVGLLTDDFNIELSGQGDVQREDMDTTAAAVEQHVTEISQEQLENTETAPGNQEYRDKVGFSYRTSLQLGLQESDFIWCLFPWQVMLSEAQSKTWEEEEVVGPDGEPGWPYPGRDGWTRWQACQQREPVNVDPTTGVAVPREDMEAEAADPTKTPLQSGWIIHTQE